MSKIESSEGGDTRQLLAISAAETERDTLFQTQQAPGPAAFEFGREVVRVFDDMVSRSVPLYSAIQRLTAAMVLRCRAPGAIYDFGCSTGATLKALIEQATGPLDLVGIDKSEEMLAACGRKLRPILGRHRVRLERGDLEDAAGLSVENCGAVVISLVAQFLHPRSRHQLLATIAQQLHPGGCLILIEKTVQRSAAINAAFIACYHEFKRARGYSEIEIARKREALEKRLIPLSAEDNLAMLRNAGFGEAEVFFAWLNFQGYLALKNPL